MLIPQIANQFTLQNKTQLHNNFVLLPVAGVAHLPCEAWQRIMILL